ncbi:MAG: YraN family protein [Patescibacteria group bacterium]
MKHNNQNSENVGKIGESVVSLLLSKKGYDVILRNYRKKWGEIDIIAEKDEIIHFVEVKTVSCENIDLPKGDHSPEENVHPEKLKRMQRTIQSYLMEKGIYEDVSWQIDVAGVFLDIAGKRARVRMTENIII